MEIHENRETRTVWTDRFGAVASSLCATHCAICAMAPAVFGALGLGMLLSHEVEWALTLVAISFGLAALVLGWRQHRSTAVLGLLILGIAGLLTSRGLEMGSGHHGHHGHHGEHHSEHHGEHHGEHEDTDEKHPDEKHADERHADERHADEKHPDERHADERHADERHADEKHPDEKHDGHDPLHAAGGGVGVLAGLLLFSGHLLNLRALRRHREEGYQPPEDCCD